MLTDQALLELCVQISGGFENSAGASYTTVAGDEDGQGFSAGVLQWNAGQGTLQILLQHIGAAMGWSKAQTYFKSDIQHLSTLNTTAAVQFCIQHYIVNGGTAVAPDAKTAWQNFLSTPESIAAQIQMASMGILSHTKSLVSQFTSAYVGRTRPYAFFFDLITQEGGMRNANGAVLPVSSATLADCQPALVMANQNNPKCEAIWEIVLPNDSLAQLLLYYAYERSILASPPYVWDALSRRGSIACLGGIVHGATVNLKNLLD
jgi:hypothetical protein